MALGDVPGKPQFLTPHPFLQKKIWYSSSGQVMWPRLGEGGCDQCYDGNRECRYGTDHDFMVKPN